MLFLGASKSVTTLQRDTQPSLSLSPAVQKFLFTLSALIPQRCLDPLFCPLFSSLPPPSFAPTTSPKTPSPTRSFPLTALCVITAPLRTRLVSERPFLALPSHDRYRRPPWLPERLQPVQLHHREPGLDVPNRLLEPHRRSVSLSSLAVPLLTSAWTDFCLWAPPKPNST